MSDEETTHDYKPQRKDVNTLVDLVTGVEEGNPLHLEVAVDDGGRVIVFHDKPFRSDIKIFEYDLNTNTLDFIMDDDEKRDLGFALKPEIAKYMQNAHQILTILLNDGTGEGVAGKYIPIIIHRS